ncbi:response regulator with CheY-like receiver domain and winged-helix DNA-binding domain [Chthonomonas calidirosea]|uniref:Response regulators consisting of a CheY-like receiver domain and a winged-helix DNA-binding domain n=1 Tax=Chthonomonas calidirosea (strain DSM 23976 / ICMP 18418 / T49) TaxID=1303518 RepID=S0EZX3_CHTCT|nr:response regulator transcription factor [Chthonomonas calidirosea]CCW36145.1 Response regulators consisting of a CheY-like receiver domain and a winged-helix DNA-binding domain [Chthonomonas calidirosea T49]CEK17144.1 response regulator with CheY-like receiver domain and winged-helix DNA-binding domain [Chthonomonas calidirosea]CEK17158.1 response regulator with CheY-like receiver domain and winged-helix DNA-binding domain [Chthonomonas calidirosea]CEK18204.1 response regulator with CheY-lik
MTRVLVVDDDSFLVRSLEKLMLSEGFFCQSASSAREALRLLEGEPFDLVVLDVGLPDMDGFSLCRRIRLKHRMPVLFLSARGESAERVVGLEVGADDYIVKPFTPREFVARVRAQLRRANEYSRPVEARNEIRIGDLVVDFDRHDAFISGKRAQLTEREFELLALLARHVDKVLSSEWIFENVWGFQSETGPKTLAVYVRRLRCKIEADPDHPKYLLTVRGFGYQLVFPS